MGSTEPGFGLLQRCNNGLDRDEDSWTCHSGDGDPAPHLNITYPCNASLAQVKVCLQRACHLAQCCRALVATVVALAQVSKTSMPVSEADNRAAMLSRLASKP